MHDDQTGLTASQPAARPMTTTPTTHAPENGSRRGGAMTTATHAEPLEERRLMASQAPINLSIAGPIVNVTRLLENQNAPSITVDRTNPGNIFIGAANDARGTGPLDDVDANNDDIADVPPLLTDVGEPGLDDEVGLIGSRSGDAGITWVTGVLDQGTTELGEPDAALPPACCDPSVAYDEFGNLFAAYTNREFGAVIVAVSTDDGQTFTTVGQFVGEVDQPTVVTGEGAVWVTFQLNGSVVAAGARVLGPGVAAVQPFSAPQVAPRSENGNFGDIAIGPNGEVIVTYQVLRNDPDRVPPEDGGGFTFGPDGEIITGDSAGPTDIYVNVDPDGFGPALFGKRFKATDTNIGIFDPIPAQDNSTINAAAGLAWDRSGGPFNGRIYLVYTNEARDEAEHDVNVYVRFSDDLGQTWSSPRKLTGDDANAGSQFFPRIALDQTSGNIGVTWYDSATKSPNGFAFNDETRVFGTVGVPTVAEAGLQFATAIQISSGFSDAHRSRALTEYGDYAGLDFHNNVLYPVWADNSNSTGDNPSGGTNEGPDSLATFDVYTTRVLVTPVADPTPDQAPVGPGSPLTPDFIGKGTVTKGRSFKFQVKFESPNGINLATLGDDDLLVTGPKGYNLFADFTKAKRAKGGTVVTATYQAPAPGGKWDSGDNGLYSILLQQGAVSDLANVMTNAGLLDQFLVASNVAPQSVLSASLKPASAALKAASTSLDSTADADDDNNHLSALGL